VELNLIATESWSDLISGQLYEDLGGVLELPPYGCVWITNKA
jgi:sucrose phosphorylase